MSPPTSEKVSFEAEPVKASGKNLGKNFTCAQGGEIMDKEKNRKQELNKLKKLLAGVEENKRKAAESLAQEVAYMKATLLELRGIIDADGLVCEGARGPTEHPAVKTYNTMIQRYATLSKQIFDLLPEGDKKDTTDELMDYVKGAKR